MTQFKKIAILLPLVLSVLACGKGGNETLAVVNGKKVSAATFDAYLKQKRIPADQKDKVAHELDRYLEREALADVILQQDVLDKEQIAVEVNEFRKQMLLARYFEEFLRDKVNEEAIQNFYASNPDRFQARKAHVAHILLRTNTQTSDSEKQALQTKAQEIYSRAMAGEDFAKLAQEYSEDMMSAKQGGDLGWLQEGAIDPVFSNTVFNMKEGEVAQPFATPFGFHVVKVVEAPQVIKQPFEKVKGDIRYELRQQAKDAEMKRLLSLVKIEKKG